MKGLGRTCLLWSLLYFALAGLAGALIYTRFPLVRAGVFGGLAAGFFIWISIGYLVGNNTRRGEARLIRKAMEGGRPADGEKVAVIGTVVGSIETLESPITRKRCLAYEYKALQGDQQQVGSIEGSALAPLTIEGPRGSIRLLAAPELAFDEEAIGSLDHQRNFRDYVARTTFREAEGINFKRDLAHLKALLADDDGRIREDVRRMKIDDYSSVALTEKTLCAGEKVIAFGRYSAARGGLVPDDTAVMHPVKIVKDDPQVLLRKLRRRLPTDLAMSCGCLLPVIIAAIVATALVPLAAIEQQFPEKDASWTEMRAERKVNETLKKYGFAPNRGEIIVDLERGQARGKVTWNGATSRLTTAAAKREGDRVTVMITGEGDGIEVQLRDNGKLESILVGKKLMVPIAEVEAEQLSVDEYDVRGRLTYLSADNEPSLRVAFRAPLQ